MNFFLAVSHRRVRLNRQQRGMRQLRRGAKELESKVQVLVVPGAPIVDGPSMRDEVENATGASAQVDLALVLAD